MVDRTLKCVFLSASIPIPGRDDEKYLNSVDVISIRDAVIAFASVVLTRFHLVWGGHPSITPLIVSVLKYYNVSINDRLTLYQSEYFLGQFPEENNYIKNIIKTEKGKDLNESLEIMRVQMLNSYNYVAGFFIGGMNGVEDEYELFKKFNSSAMLIPVASTGGAAKIIYESNKDLFDSRLESDLVYSSLFKDLLKNV